MTNESLPESAAVVPEELQEPVQEPDQAPSQEPPIEEPGSEGLSIDEPPADAPPIDEPPQGPPAIDPPQPAPPVKEPPREKPAKESPADEPAPEEPQEDFGALLSAFEKSHSHKAASAPRQLQGTVVSISAEQVFLDIGYKTEGVLPRSAFPNNAEGVKLGDSVPVSVTGRNEEHYYELSRFKVAQPRDWSALEAAFAEKLAVVGTVTEVIKGGLSVDIGVRAFMPASRSGTKDAVELEKLVGTEITCRITKLDVTDENVVVDRRVVLEEQARALTQATSEALQASIAVGDVLTGTVRTLMPYGAFIDLGGIDGLLHVSDIAHTRITKPEDVLTVGQEVQVKILKIDPETRKLSLGLKQLQAEPWETAPSRLTAGQRVTGRVTRLMDFGAFVEIEPGIEGLIHISEMAWGKKVRHPSDILKQGDTVDAVILSVKPEERRIALGLKQTLTDPWSNALERFPIGSQIEGPVTKLMNFGAFVQLVDGIEGLVHVSEISADRRINHPSDVLRVGQAVKAQVLALDIEKRQIKLSMKQLIPTSIDEYIAEHKPGDTVSGRVVEHSATQTIVELGEGIRAICRIGADAKTAKPEGGSAAKVDLSSLSSMLKDRWKGNTPAAASTPEPLSAGQIRSFKIVRLDAETKKIEVELA
ncbi:MAG: S1 RNA-binding domain-containing protein [Terracidiphilus sp.]